MMRTVTLFIALCMASVCTAKDIKTVVLTTTPQMHCANCEKKIKENIRFEKGIKSIKTNLQDKTVTIERCRQDHRSRHHRELPQNQVRGQRG